MDILHPTVAISMTKGTMFPFYLILVDAYGRFACIYGLSDKSSECVIDTLTRYQADHGHIGNYSYLDIARVRADSGSQFTSEEFKKHFWEAGIQLSLAAPQKQYQNHLAERTWQTIGTMARSLLKHAQLPDSFMYHALVYSCHIFNVLPVKGLYSGNQVATPYELFQGTKPNISHFRVFGCPVTARKWTINANSHGKQTECGIRGIFVGFDANQKGYMFFLPASCQLYTSADILFDEEFSSTIAHTWHHHRDSLALRPVSSTFPLTTTTLEHTGKVAQSLVEEGTHMSCTHMSPEPPLVEGVEECDDNVPDLIDHDDDSTAAYDLDSEIDDEDILDLETPAQPEPASISPQPIVELVGL